MITDYYIDLQADTGQIDVTVRLCTGCGEVIDPIILENRKVLRLTSCTGRSNAHSANESKNQHPVEKRVTSKVPIKDRWWL